MIYKNSLIWDAHTGIFPNPDVDLNLLNNWAESGISYVSMNVGYDAMDWQDTLATLAAYRRWIDMNSDRFIRVDGVRDIDRARSEGKLAVGFDIEGMNALNGDINMVSVYHSLGVKQMLFAYNLNNLAAGGCHDTDTGLTLFGREIVREMNRLGILVDCSHTSYTTTMDIMSESDAPVIFSHSNPSMVWEHQRNISDDQIKACAETGGVIGINGLGIFLGDNDVTNETFLKHICYLIEIVGPEHIGIGLDYSPEVDVDIGDILKTRSDFWPPGQQYETPGIKHAEPGQLQDLAVMMEKCGLSESDIQGILGGNFRRVAQAVW